MDYCLCNITAFEVLRRLDFISSAAYEPNPSEVLGKCSMANTSRLKTQLNPFYIPADSIHLLVGESSQSGTKKGIARHVAAAELSAHSVFQLETGLYCTSPEETYLSLAQTLLAETSKDLRFKAEAVLAFWGMELCGLYYFNAKDNALAKRNLPLTSKAKLASYLEKCACRPGVAFARRALEHVEDKSRSPMESACALLLCRARRIGSLGLPLGEINCTLETSEGVREVDRVWKKYGLGYEYQGREYHTGETRRQEDRRRNALLGSGITIVNIWYEDIAQPEAFDNLSKTLAKTMGKRLRIRDKSFKWRQHVLRSVVLPSINRFS